MIAYFVGLDDMFWTVQHVVDYTVDLRTRDDRFIPAIQVYGEARGVGEALVQPHILLVLLCLLLRPVGSSTAHTAAPQRGHVLIL